MKASEAVIQLPSQARFVNPALAFIRGIASSCGFSDPELTEIEIAAEEALTNIIKHAFEGDADETFRLSVRFTESHFYITFYEKGMPFSPDRAAKYDPEKLKETEQADGLGLFLIKRMMDDVLFENLGRDGKSLTLVKHIKDSQKKAVLESCGNEVLIKGGHQASAEDLLYEIRPFRPEDALEISRCAYKAYGYTYEPYIYYPEQIIEMNSAGKLRSFIAAGRGSGEIMGHIALKYKNPDDRIAEIGVAFVKPEYRKSGIFNALMHFGHEKAEELELYGLFGRAVTSHIGSQKVTDAMGYLVCGMFMGLFPDDVDFKALTGKIRQKETGLLLYRPLFTEGERTIYTPLRHQEKILDMFSSFKIAVRPVNGMAEPDSGQSRIDAETVPALNVAYLVVNAIGGDIIHELKAIIHGLCLKHLDAIFLHLDMEDPYSPFVVQQCEQLGFFFAGVLPFGLNNRHEFVLQHMNNLAINYDIIKPYSESAVAILEYVRSCDPGEETD